MHRYLYAYGNPTVWIDLYGYESIEVDKDSNKVYWNIEKDWYGPYNPKSRQVHIGEKEKDGNVKLTQEFGGGIVAHEHLKMAAAKFWLRVGTESVMNPEDISNEAPGYQDMLISTYLDDVNIRRDNRIEQSGLKTKKSYLEKSKNQLFYGNYTDDVTALGTGAQIATGLVGLDLPGDVRDLKADIDNFEWSKQHVGQTLIDTAGLFPLIGVLKYTDEAKALYKGGPSVDQISKAKSGQGHTLAIKYEKGWNKRDFSRKVRAMEYLAKQGKLFDTPTGHAKIVRNSEITKQYKSNLIVRAYKKHGKGVKFESIKRRILSMDPDHINELQTMGPDAMTNLWMLDRKVNQGIGRQILNQRQSWKKQGSADWDPITDVKMQW